MREWNQKGQAFKKMKFVLKVLVFGILIFTARVIYSQGTGYKYFRYYTQVEYDHSFQNWAITQAENGMIYVANGGGLLEFDGVTWRPFGIPEWATVRSLAIDETGTIYIGGVKKIGFLEPKPDGTFKYVSLVDHLEESEKNFSNVWNTHATKEGIYFQTYKFLFRWDPEEKKMKSWPSSSTFWSAFVCNGDYIVNEKDRGLFKMVGDKRQPMPGSERFKEKKYRVYVMIPYDKNGSREYIVGTKTEGLYLYDEKNVKPFPTEVDEYLKQNQLYRGIRLKSGDIALATLQGGLVVLDSKGSLKRIFNKNYGLKGNIVLSVFEDIRGNLWLGQLSEISKIEYAAPISLFDKRSNLPEAVVSAIKYKNVLYAGTNDGLFYFESPGKFRKVTGISNFCWSLLEIGDSLLAATTSGVFQVEKDSAKRIIENNSYALLSSRFKDLVWCGTSAGLKALVLKNGKWTVMTNNHIVTVNQEIRTILEDEKGNVWLGTMAGKIFKVEFTGNITKPIVSEYNKNHGLPDGEISVTAAAGHIVFLTTKGLYRLGDKKKTIVPDRILGNKYAGGPNGLSIFRLLEDKNKHIWFGSGSRIYHAVPEPDGAYKIHARVFRRLPLTAQVNSIYPAPDGNIVWFASHIGLIRYDLTYKGNYPKDFQTLLRKVILNEKQESERKFFDGNNIQSYKDAKTSFPEFEYKDRNIHFEFATPFFQAENAIEYQSFLEGYDRGWSNWSKETKRNYTNLDAGQYTFHVRARNIYEDEGKEDVFKFTILPPWYQTWWAYLSYLILLLMLIFLIVKWRSRKLELAKQALEITVKERTQEIREKNIQLKEQSKKLQELDKAKSLFFANISHEFRTPLTLIMSPAEQMQSELEDKQQKKRLGVMLRNAQRLLTLINQLLDLAKLDSGKMKLQSSCQYIATYLEEMLVSFQEVAQQKKIDLKFHALKEDILLYFDPPKLEEVMYNLLSNALNFTGEGGSITVSVSIEEKESAKESPGLKSYVKISVQDTGIGVSKEELERVFDRFYQAGSFKEKRHKGTGIGLSLTREIVLLHHGTIDIHSQEDKGTEFVIRLPLGNDHLKPEEMVFSTGIPPKPQKGKEIKARFAESEEEAEIEEPVKKTGEHEKPVILVVEDEIDVRKYICEPLKTEYKIIEAGNGKEGIEMARKENPDLIVSDIMMPETDGIELCKTLKKDIDTSHIPIILLTAKAGEESVMEGLETGADDYITKPFNAHILLTRIKNLIDLRLELWKSLQRKNLKIPSKIKVSPLDEQFLFKFRGIIEKKLTDPDFRLEAIYEELKMPRSTFFKKIKALTGGKPNSFILSYRLERARQLLKENYGNVTDVAMAVGFNSSSYFTKCFTKEYGISPSSYQASESNPKSEPKSEPDSPSDSS
jgi:signal transduction histidine kinase/AraC-like DNA-binding protein